MRAESAMRTLIGTIDLSSLILTYQGVDEDITTEKMKPIKSAIETKLPPRPSTSGSEGKQAEAPLQILGPPVQPDPGPSEGYVDRGDGTATEDLTHVMYDREQINGFMQDALKSLIVYGFVFFKVCVSDNMVWELKICEFTTGEIILLNSSTTMETDVIYLSSFPSSMVSISNITVDWLSEHFGVANRLPTGNEFLFCYVKPGKAPYVNKPVPRTPLYKLCSEMNQLNAAQNIVMAHAAVASIPQVFYERVPEAPMTDETLAGLQKSAIEQSRSQIRGERALENDMDGRARASMSHSAPEANARIFQTNFNPATLEHQTNVINTKDYVKIRVVPSNYRLAHKPDAMSNPYNGTDFLGAKADLEFRIQEVILGINSDKQTSQLASAVAFQTRNFTATIGQYRDEISDLMNFAHKCAMHLLIQFFESPDGYSKIMKGVSSKSEVLPDAQSEFKRRYDDLQKLGDHLLNTDFEFFGDISIPKDPPDPNFVAGLARDGAIDPKRMLKLVGIDSE